MWAYQSKKWKWKRKDGNLKEKVAKEREREKGGRRGGVTVNCVGVEAKRSSTLDLSALGCSALHRAVSKESTARQTLPPVKTFHKIFPRKTLSGIQHEWKLRYSYLQRRKLLCAHCWKDVFQASATPLRTWQRRFWIEVHGSRTRKWYPWSSVWKGVPQQQRASLFFFSGGEGGSVLWERPAIT